MLRFAMTQDEAKDVFQPMEWVQVLLFYQNVTSIVQVKVLDPCRNVQPFPILENLQQCRNLAWM